MKFIREQAWQTMEVRYEEIRPVGDFRLPVDIPFMELEVANNTKMVEQWANSVGRGVLDTWFNCYETTLPEEMTESQTEPGVWSGKISPELAKGKIYSEKRAEAKPEAHTIADTVLGKGLEKTTMYG